MGEKTNAAAEAAKEKELKACEISNAFCSIGPSTFLGTCQMFFGSRESLLLESMCPVPVSARVIGVSREELVLDDDDHFSFNDRVD